MQEQSTTGNQYVEPEKRCSKCGISKPVTAFHPNQRYSMGVIGQCKACRLVASRERDQWYASLGSDPRVAERQCSKCGMIKPADLFGRDRYNRDGLQSQCKSCISQRIRPWKAQPKQRSRSYQRNYGLTLEQVQAMAEGQGNACAICRTAFDSCRMHVDHCHETNTVRGLLCHRCNCKLGGIEDRQFLRLALSYLGRENG